MFNRDKEKKFFKADPLTMKTTKQMDYTGEQVPYERVKKNRPATSYGPFISSTSYGHNFQGWDAGGYVPTLVPKGNLQSTTNMPFRAVSAYRDTYKGTNARPGTGIGVVSGTMGGVGGAHGADGTMNQNAAATDPNLVFGGKNRAQRSQISMLSSPDKKLPFQKDTTNRTEFRGQKSLERSRPIKHPDNLGNVDLKVEPDLYNTSYRTNFNNFGSGGPCKREVERVTVRRELKQLQ